MDNVIFVLNQSHLTICYYSLGCLTLYVTSILRDRIDVSCACPSYQCSQNGWLTESEIKELLPSDVYERFSLKKLQREIEQNINLTFCPAVNCGAVCQVPTSLKVTLPNGSNPPAKGNRRTIERFSRWYKKYLCSGTHNSSNSESAIFRGNSSSRIQNHTYEKSVNTVTSETEDHVMSPINQFMEQKSLPFTSEKQLLTCQVTPVRPAVRIVCKQCSHEFCARCHLNWHSGRGPYVCEEYTESILPRSKNKKLGTHSKNQRNLRGVSKKHADTFSTTNHIGIYASSNPGALVKNKSEYISKMKSLRQPSEKNRKKLSFSRSKMKQGGYSQSRSSIHLSNNDVSDKIDVSVLTVGFPPYSPDDWLKRCPACLVPIERIEGCAQMMCRSCKHTFCWYCLTSLDDDFLLQHYDDGACKGKLGHSRASVIGHRVYVVSVFTGLTILLLVAAPFIMIAVPCIICAKCHRVYHQHRLRKRHSQGLYLVDGRAPVTSDSSDVQVNRTDTPQPASSSPHNSIFISSCRSSIANIDQRQTVEQKADIHWLPWQESKHNSPRKVMHRSKSVPIHCHEYSSNNLVIPPHTP
uniref:RBR-type E3 ubiquitin transferase n=1 Tax=Trichobilharzia regenti TaxID=157069 RepID=A0AA85JH91_TRIRE|nr:unnamed protein product [Trichobilharzia regenti]